MSKFMKGLVVIILTIALGLGSLAASGGSYDAYKLTFGEARWQVKFNQFLDACSGQFNGLSQQVGALSTLATNWLVTENYQVVFTGASYSNGTTFTLSGDQTAKITAGKLIWADLGAMDGVKASTISTASFGSGTTTVVIANSILTSNLRAVSVVSSRNGVFPTAIGWVFGRDYGSAGQSALDASLAVIGVNERTLSLGPGTWSVTADTAIPANVTLKPEHGAVLAIATTKTLTINGPLEAGPYQIFSCTGTGKVAFGREGVKEVYPEWWGAKGDNSTDCTAAITAAQTAAHGIHVPMRLGSGVYLISSPLKWDASILGAGIHATDIKATAGFTGTMMLDFNGTEAGLQHLFIKDVLWSASDVTGLRIFASSSAGGAGGSSKGIFEHVYFCDVDPHVFAVGGSSTIAEDGMLTGSVWIGCEWVCFLMINAGNNQDDVTFINSRLSNWCAGTPTSPAVQAYGTNVKFLTTYFSIGYGTSQSGNHGFIAVGSYPVTIDSMFVEGVTASDWFIDCVNPEVRLDVRNLNMNVGYTGAAPEQCIVRVPAETYGVHSLSFSGIYKSGSETPSWNKIFGIYVPSAAQMAQLDIVLNNASLYTEANQVTFATSAANALPFVSLMGLNGGRFQTRNGTSTTGMYDSLVRGVYSTNLKVLSSSGGTPLTATFTLPTAGDWLLSVTANNCADNSDHRAVALFLVTFSPSGTYNILASQQIGVTQVCGYATTLTLSNPSASGVVTATAAWSGGGSYITGFIFKAKRLSDFLDTAW